MTDQYIPVVEQFKNDPVTFTYVQTKDVPFTAKQFGINGNVGAVICKPKRAKYVKLEGVESSQAQLDPSDVSKLVESALSGGG